ncbi:hypothetical protein GGI07_004456 [Coemansia sp. Benny D115]|nr:hypothetical protein GGI07_004456 [Coemansia sp. Benny D115]
MSSFDRLHAPVESLADQYTVTEIDSQGVVRLQPPQTAQDQMTKQIAQLWEAHANFQGLDSDCDSDSASQASKEPQTTTQQSTADNTTAQELDAYAVRAKVHESLILAQSEIEVSLDIVRLLLAAKKKAARESVLAQQASTTGALLKHDQVPRTSGGVLSFDALVGGESATNDMLIGNLPFAVGMLDTIKTELPRQGTQQQQQSVNAVQFVLGAKHRQLYEAADTLESASTRLRAMVASESRFWHTAYALRRRNWVVQNQGDRYFVRYGYGDSGSTFAEGGIAELLRIEDAEERQSGDLDEPEDDGLYIPNASQQRIRVRLASEGDASDADSGYFAGGRDTVDTPAAGGVDRAHRRLLEARSALFDRELFHRLCKEARVLELGSVRAMPAADPDSTKLHDVLVSTLSRDDDAVRFEWLLDDQQGSHDTAAGQGHQQQQHSVDRSFATWQRQHYADVAHTIACMHLRRQHRETKRFVLGDSLAASSSMVASRGPPPEAFGIAVGDATGSPVPGGSAHESAAAAISRPELLLLSPVLQGVQFARWQNLLSVSIQRACAAWRRLVDEPIEVISHFGRTFRTPSEHANGNRMSPEEMREWQRFYKVGRSSSSASDSMAFVVRMRFQGGTVMAIRLDSHGSLFFAKGYFPPPAPVAVAQQVPGASSPPSTTSSPNSLNEQEPLLGVGAWPEQKFIHRVFRIVPLGGLSEFTDQLRRELQSLVLLRVAAALSRCSYQRVGEQCQMGHWYVHQSQLCVVGEWWQGARHRQIIGVAKWGLVENPSAVSPWDLCLYFGPKHPTVFDLPSSAQNSERIFARVPWITCYPPPRTSSTAPATSQGRIGDSFKTFEEKLLHSLVSAF